ncbi:MAG: Fic family protein [Acidobacteria bacterium]|nr:Fic family protein [Acidobacteriota bacterium]
MRQTIARAGRIVKQPAGYSAFIPAPLPPDPRLEIDSGLLSLLSEADRTLGRLDGVSGTLPNPDLFVAMYVRREAVLSSQIEGTQSSLEDVLDFELDPAGRELPGDVVEVVNYVRAMNYGLERIKSLPLSLRLIREIHAKLLEGVRGNQRLPGEFRRSQNWIGSAGATLAQAAFVPPPVNEMHTALGDLERFLHVDTFPPLIHAGLVHAQFETIHPFLDGNGRVGRLLVTFLLVQHNVLRRPLLYLSHYLKRQRAEYYDRLMAIRQAGDWEGWLRFFLRGAAETGREASSTATAIIELRDQHRALIQERSARAAAFRLLDLLFQWPVLNVNLVKQRLKVSFATSNKLVEQFQEWGLLEETTGHKRNRRYRYTPYLRLFQEQEVAASADTVQTTESVEKGAES